MKFCASDNVGFAGSLLVSSSVRWPAVGAGTASASFTGKESPKERRCNGGTIASGRGAWAWLWWMERYISQAGNRPRARRHGSGSVSTGAASRSRQSAGSVSRATGLKAGIESPISASATIAGSSASNEVRWVPFRRV